MRLNFSIKCACGEQDDSQYYISPELVVDRYGRITLSFTNYEVICKRCRRIYKLRLKLDSYGRAGRG